MLRVLRHRDFRILWLGALVSFTGGQVQAVAQGFYVYEVTRDPTKLALVMFFMLLPVSLFGPFLGLTSDIFDRRKLMIGAMIIQGLGAAFLGFGAVFGYLQYWHFLVVAASTGVIMAIELPARQSIVRLVVPDEELPIAVPTQAMSFNLSRVGGPALGGVILAAFGPAVCFFLNALSFGALIISMLLIRTDLSNSRQDMQPIGKLVFEGIQYVWQNISLRTLFILECITSTCGMMYIALMPAITRTMLGLGEIGLGIALSCVGIGALTAVFTLANVSHHPIKALAGRTAMVTVGGALILLSLVPNPILAYGIFVILGGAVVIQFNTTNTLFQMLSPGHLKGRILSMHMWAITGASPFGILFFGWLGNRVSLEAALASGGVIVVIGGVMAFIHRDKVVEPLVEISSAKSGAA